MPGPCGIRKLRLVGGLLMYESLMRYILQYHELFPYLIQVDYHPFSAEDIQDRLTAFVAVTAFDPPLVPVDRSRRILLTLSPEPDSDAIFTFFHSLSWNMASPRDSVST